MEPPPLRRWSITFNFISVHNSDFQRVRNGKRRKLNSYTVKKSDRTTSAQSAKLTPAVTIHVNSRHPGDVERIALSHRVPPSKHPQPLSHEENIRQAPAEGCSVKHLSSPPQHSRGHQKQEKSEKLTAKRNLETRQVSIMWCPDGVQEQKRTRGKNWGNLNIAATWANTLSILVHSFWQIVNITC